MREVSLVIPIFNEEKNILNLYQEIVKFIKDYNYELIFVNDNSSDQSKFIIHEIQTKNSLVKCINHEKNLGQSCAIYSGINAAQYNTIITLDGDGQNNPADIPNLLKNFFYKNDVSLISGIRYNRKDNFIKIISSKIANKVRSYILNDKCSDTGCSLKVFDKSKFLEFPFFDGIHRFMPALFNGYGHKVLFINVDHRSRISGESKYGIINRLFKGIFDLIKVRNIIKTYEKKNN